MGDPFSSPHDKDTRSRRKRRKLHRAFREAHDRAHDHDHDHIGERMRHHEGPHSRGGRHRARRGAIVTATLLLLDERPMHGYELITELEARSEGRWRPSPGTMYPALHRMEDKGLVTATEIDGKKQFSLTDAGRTRVTEYRDTRGDDDPAPWDERDQGGRGDLRSSIAELTGQAKQIGRFGTPEQIEQAKEVFAETKRKLYVILASEPETGDGSDDKPTSTDD